MWYISGMNSSPLPTVVSTGSLQLSPRPLQRGSVAPSAPAKPNKKPRFSRNLPAARNIRKKCISVIVAYLNGQLLSLELIRLWLVQTLLLGPVGDAARAEIYQFGSDAIRGAARFQEAEIMAALIAADLHMYPPDDWAGMTPLHYVAVEGFTEGARMLLDHEHDLYAKDVLGNTPRDRAEREGHLELAALLLAAETQSPVANLAPAADPFGQDDQPKL